MGQKNFDAAFYSDAKLILQHHRRLTKVLADLIRADNLTIHSEIASATLSEINAHFEFFFKIQKQHLKRYEYPHYDKHLGQHKIFLRRFVALCDNFANNGTTTKNDFLSFAEELKSHLSKFHDEYAQYLKDCGCDEPDGAD